MIKHINDNDFEQEVIKEEGVVLVDFFAEWCGPCKMIAPILEEISNEMNNVKIVKVDVDQCPETANKYFIQSIPTLKVFKNGEDIDTRVGFLPKASLLELINKSL